MIVKIWQNSNVNVNEQPVKVLLNPNVQVSALKASYPAAKTPLDDDDKFVVRQDNDWREVERKELKEIVHRVELTGRLDWSKPVEYRKILLRDEFFTDINLPTGTETRLIVIHMKGNHNFAVPDYWHLKGGEYDGTKWNMIVADCVNGNPGEEWVNYIILPDVE